MLKNIIEALLFASGDGFAVNEIVYCLDSNYSEKQVNKALAELKSEYSGNSGIILVEFNNKIQFQTNPMYGEILSNALTPTKERQLSKTLLEVLAIIAYQQPVTRGEIEAVRGGVSADYACSMLQKFNLIVEVGRKTESVGRPIQYGTTEEFLKKFGLKSLEDLPDFEELMTKIRNNFEKYYKSDDDKLFREKEFVPTDEFFEPATDELPEHLEGEEEIMFFEVAADAETNDENI